MCLKRWWIPRACACSILYTWLPNFVKRNYEGAYGILSIILLYPISRIQFSVAPALKLFHSDHAIDDGKFYCEGSGHHHSFKLSTCEWVRYRYFESIVIVKQPKKSWPKIKALQPFETSPFTIPLNLHQHCSENFIFCWIPGVSSMVLPPSFGCLKAVLILL